MHRRENKYWQRELREGVEEGSIIGGGPGCRSSILGSNNLPKGLTIFATSSTAETNRQRRNLLRKRAKNTNKCNPFRYCVIMRCFQFILSLPSSSPLSLYVCPWIPLADCLLTQFHGHADFETPNSVDGTTPVRRKGSSIFMQPEN